jgi:hypothetical protein
MRTAELIARDELRDALAQVEAAVAELLLHAEPEEADRLRELTVALRVADERVIL